MQRDSSGCRALTSGSGFADSAGAICRKYEDNRLAVKQMVMMIEWLEEVYEKQRQAG
ncbi:hypothetical protein [Paenibacillus sp. 1A_MP2]|uniref:hypothetical protein n=1 Tax=Paenibacillus sp. 1A_MP2 TaxID=3457495 RepID=UPI003FCE54D7